MSETVSKLPPAAFQLLRYWKTARGPHVLPHRSAIDPIKLRDWLRDLSIIEIHKGEKRFFVRLHGTETTENLGQDFSRKYLEDCTTGLANAIAVRPYLTSIDALLPTYSSVEADQLSGVFTSLDRLVLPFTDVDQDQPDAPVSVDRFLTWLGPTDRQRGEDSAVYLSPLPASAAGTNGGGSRPAGLFVIDVDDKRYGLDVPSQSSTPFAAQRPLAKHP